LSLCTDNLLSAVDSRSLPPLKSMQTSYHYSTC
jgi:hypothetical protein